ncbi:MAG TPA: preprotein translocase subunit SecY [Candidatus Thermoplasmatota archaeon]|nr:preprotein translocase subunit SecY [Candidatus Thermoplasmatota archaeon]
MAKKKKTKLTPDEELDLRGKSKLYWLRPLARRMPVVAKPKEHVRFKTKFFWTSITLLFYFAMTNVFLFGLDPASNQVDLFRSFRAILGGAQGSIMHLGIGPIVTGSIIMQLFTGAKIFKLDLTNADDKSVYQGVQKIVVILMIVVESWAQVQGFLTPSPQLVSNLNGHFLSGTQLAKGVIILQLIVGSYLVFLLDELVSKWGIGSGISLFIAAGVAQQIITGAINWAPSDPAAPISFGSATSQANLPAGTIPKVWYAVTHASAQQLSQGYYEQVFLSPPNSIIALMGTAATFIIVAYAETTRLELPLAHTKVRGARGRYPIRLVYASNIPVILMAALLANINMIAVLLYSGPLQGVPFLGHNDAIGRFDVTGEIAGSATVPIGGLAWYVSQPAGVQEWLLPLINYQRYSGYTYDHGGLQVFLHIVVYLGFMIGGSVLFAKFWIETTNMGPEAVAKQIQKSGMQIPGFRRDPKVLRRVLEQYIPTVTIMSGAFVGALAGFADMIGTTGQSSGTGVLLMVGIVIRMSEEIVKEREIDRQPVLARLFGFET